ncbi:hypothetical protein MHO82_11635 [Vibrio sp. Of7-15]|uniref:hypothetical protein n=1 Tax=Vibrio sp. Of7-15 TaxID=2724879 RepID=UPI001EF277BA|nr:hypothetical protein [Vibrio sp. Of7-15]MCG7497517.1 hypothetical protein [Vibrio sp. Of7-15]
MKILTTALLASLSLFASQAHSDAFGVSLKWATTNSQAVFENFANQKSEFNKLIQEGSIHDVYISQSKVEGKDFPLIKFVIEADSQQAVFDKLNTLPFYQQELVAVDQIRNIGTKWLDKELVQQNYSMELSWKQPQQHLIVDEILGKDLQQVVDWNSKGKVTSTYLNIQDVGDKTVRPIYSIAVLANNVQEVQHMAQQLEAINSGYASVHIMHLGFKMNMNTSSDTPVNL